MSIDTNRARGTLLGLACGDALGRPVEFRSQAQIEAEHGRVTEMLGQGTHGQPPGTVTDDTEMALCIAESLAEQGGFDGADVAERFVDWLESGPFDIGLMTRDSLERIRNGVPWDEAGHEVWEERPEGSNAGNGSVMRCAPYGIAFRHFEDELVHVSRQSSAITHADPRCQWGCAILNRTIAGLIRGEEDPLGSALELGQDGPKELRRAVDAVHQITNGSRPEAHLRPNLSTTGYVVDSLQAGLYFGLTADSAEQAIVEAVNRGDDTDTVGAIAGAVAGARFGASDLPTRWIEPIDEADRLRRLGSFLLRLRREVSDQSHDGSEDGSTVLKGRTIEGPALIPAQEFQHATIGHRPDPAPHRVYRTDYHALTPATAAKVDWERRAYAVASGRSEDYVSPDPGVRAGTKTGSSDLVPVPQYPFQDEFSDLPEIDRERIERDAQAAATAFVDAFAAMAGVRQRVIDEETDAIGIARRDSVVGATRVLTPTFDEFGNCLLNTRIGGGYASSEEIRSGYDENGEWAGIATRPQAISKAMEQLPDLESGTAAVLDYLVHLRPGRPDTQQEAQNDADAESITSELRNEARSAVGHLAVVRESLRRVAVRHPEIQHEPWMPRASDTKPECR